MQTEYPRTSPLELKGVLFPAGCDLLGHFSASIRTEAPR